MKPAILALLPACSATKPAPVVPSATSSCADLACITAHQGKVIDIAGVYVAPIDTRRKGLHLRKLTLADGTVLVLHAKHGPLRDGQQIVVRGIVYQHPIPERYGIIQSTAEPYVVEIFDVR